MTTDATVRPPNAFFVIAATLALVVIVGGSFALLSVCGRDSKDTVELRRAAARVETRTRLEKEALEKLNSEGWVDKAKGIVHVRIDTAIPAVIAELGAKQPGPSQVKVETVPMASPVAPAGSPAETSQPVLPSAPQGANTLRFEYPQSQPSPIVK